jgi:hypothetical protein
MERFTLDRRRLLLGLAGLPLAAALPRAAWAGTSAHPTFFVGRLEFATNDGGDCGDVGRSLAQLVAKTSTIEVQNERPVKLDDPALFDTPFVFMNGHDDFVLGEPELENLRRYFVRGGFVLGSGCCTNPEFPIAWRREFSRVFPAEVVQPVGYEHPIYRSFYKIERIHSLNGERDILIDGLAHESRLVAVLCEDGLCCSFAMDNECNRGKGLVPDDGRKLALNIAVYSLTH